MVTKIFFQAWDFRVSENTPIGLRDIAKNVTIGAIKKSNISCGGGNKETLNARLACNFSMVSMANVNLQLNALFRRESTLNHYITWTTRRSKEKDGDHRPSGIRIVVLLGTIYIWNWIVKKGHINRFSQPILSLVEKMLRRSRVV